MSPSEPITLYRGWQDSTKHVWSPFVVKVEARLRFAGVPYTTHAGSRQASPRGKIPYIESDGEGFGDSTLIVARLVERGVIPEINAKLPPETQTLDLALRAMLEDKLYFYHVSLHTAYFEDPDLDDRCGSAGR